MIVIKSLFLLVLAIMMDIGYGASIDDQSMSEGLKIHLYPGYGWDHLKFDDMLPVYNVRNYNSSVLFQQCIAVVPIRKNKLDVRSDLIDLYNTKIQDYTKSDVKDGTLDIFGAGLGGSFSDHYQEIKYQQGRENTITFHNEINYIMADVILMRSCLLDERIKQEIIAIGEYLQTNQRLTATYYAQLFIRRYGTHYVNRVRLGAKIVEDTFIKRNDYYQSNKTETRQEIKNTVKASFLKLLNLSANYVSSTSMSEERMRNYSRLFTHKIIDAVGGKPYLLGQSLENWQSTVEDNPVVLQRQIENITMAIDTKQIPELSESIIHQVIQEINRAIETYVEMNTYYGCLDRSSKIFNWLANVADTHACVNSSNFTQLQFGGMVRTCEVISSFKPYEDVCAIHKTNNFYTNTLNCPNGFNKSLLHTSNISRNHQREESYSCGILWLSTCYKWVYWGTSIAQARLYVCNPAQQGGSRIIYLYGGSFTKTKSNSVTNTATCPLQFTAINVVNDITICLAERISDRRGLGLPNYGGMYSCQERNAITASNNTNSTTLSCPLGFSSYAVGILEGDCVLYVCLEFEQETIDQQMLPTISLPPYFTILDRNLTDEHTTTTTTTTRILGQTKTVVTRSYPV